MTQAHAAAAAATQQNWPKALRITEAMGARPTTPPEPGDVPFPGGVQAVLSKLYAAWRWLESKRSQQIASRRLRVSETISLGEKRTISIVTVDGAHYLIGSSAGGVQLLTRLDEPARQTSRTEVSR